jgi:pullulanase/glycogen debranching enzyme
VGEDFNHQLPGTQNYVKRVIKQWIQEYKIDGFRWDLTKVLHKIVLQVFWWSR